MREEDPFEDQPRTPLVYEVSPYVTRLRLMWENMRDKVVELFPEAPGKIDDVEGYLRSVDEKYSEDAYHSLSIEDIGFPGTDRESACRELEAGERR